MARLIHDTRASTAIEYSLIALLVSVAIFGSLALLGGTLPPIFATVTAGLGGASGSGQ